MGNDTTPWSAIVSPIILWRRPAWTTATRSKQTRPKPENPRSKRRRFLRTETAASLRSEVRSGETVLRSLWSRPKRAGRACGSRHLVMLG
jgi:hypothetical protein